MKFIRYNTRKELNNLPYFSKYKSIDIILLQLISYKIAKSKGCDIDKPRNITKSVTVK